MNEIVDLVIFQQSSSRFHGLAEHFFAVGSGKDYDRGSDTSRIPEPLNPWNYWISRIARNLWIM